MDRCAHWQCEDEVPRRDLHFEGLRKPVVKGCPACLREDVASDPENPLAAMVMRCDWQMRDMAICLRHQTALVP